MKKLMCLLGIICVMACGGCNSSKPVTKAELPEPTVRPAEDVYGSDIYVTIDNIPVEAVTINGETAVALEDLSFCDFEKRETKDGEAFNMVGGYSGNYQGNDVTNQPPANTLLGKTSASADITRVNGVIVDNDFYNGKHYAAVSDLCNMEDEYNKEWGYSDYNMRMTENGNSIAIDCFRFPAVDMGKNLENAQPLVTNAEFGLYTEGDTAQTEHFGGMFEPETGVFAGINGDGNGDGTKENPPLFEHDFGCYSNYIEFDYMQDDLFMPNKKIVPKKDCVMLVPWNTSDVTLAFNPLYEDYIKDTLDNLKKYNKPLIVRYACEMNIGDLGLSPSAYVKAFRHIADIVHEYGFAVMWSPNDVSSLNQEYSWYYPGDEYVDWVGVSSFIRKDFMNRTPTSREEAILFNCGDFGWHTNSLKYILQFMEENNINKPVAVSEGGVISKAEYDGAPDEYTKWAYDRLGNMYWYLPMRYPQVKMINYFNHTTPGAEIGYFLGDRPDYIPIIDEALNSGAYILNASDSADFVFTQAQDGEYTQDLIPLYYYVYLPEEEFISVTYIIDGVEKASKTQIPFKYELKNSDLPEGTHALTIKTTGSVNEYTDEYELIKTNGTIKIVHK